MSLRLQLWMVFLAPLALLAGVYALGLTIPVPHLGRDYVLRLSLPDVGANRDLPTIYGPADSSRPLVLIDPGHGGHDPGASGAGFREKSLVLGLATALKDELIERGGIRVAMTREDDTFLLPAERDDLARRLGADLFLSIHADSAGEQSGVKGASVYTLSNVASSEAAARFAQRENASDRINGVKMASGSDGVSDILVELSQRRTQEGSVEFARLLLREGDGIIDFHPQPRRSAALAVLRAPDVPSVLYESGFISNPADARRLASAEGRDAFADVMARTIRIFFARRSAG
ncbi:N-acetylmuramoyl-L-alanine amidase [Altererythrobacter aquiaggeris]|uniref:N-acetylmuramoyl-L-alanine amidase family protein n=1 Tax=Aestuarierythrobacter aquiaggeris TaxID=1898396 RepID=UPI00301991D9